MSIKPRKHGGMFDAEERVSLTSEGGPDDGSVSLAPGDVFTFADEHEEGRPDDTESGQESSVWRILVTDDDEEVHNATGFALRGILIDGRRLELLHAYSAVEAEAILRATPDVAVAMLDVVMETPDAGLNLVGVIRDAIGLRNMRIVLRTGQPGYAPELDVIRRYDINDYRTKSELTQTRLITTLTAAVRAYAQLEHIHAINRGLDLVARSANEVFSQRSSGKFAREALRRLEAMIGVVTDSLICAEGRSSTDSREEMTIRFGSGRYASLEGCLVERSVDAELQRSIRRCMAARTCIFEPARTTIWLGSGGQQNAVVVIDHERVLFDSERRLVEMFAVSLAVGFDNVDLIERLDFFAYYDPLTHLPNRVKFFSDVDQDLFAHAQADRCLALADVVRFSEINDALGHRCGDTLLIGVAKRLRSVAGTEVLLARLSGDTFGFYGPLAGIEPEKIQQAFDAPFFVHGHALTVQVRIGLVRAAECKGGAAELVRNANLAVNEARRVGGGGVCRFSSGLSEDVQSRVSLLHNLRAAIDFKRGLSLYYQPIVHARSGEVLGLEALLRWRNDFGEMISPRRFIPLAEQSGLINDLGGWVVGQALECLADWRARGLPGLGMTVNLSPVQLRSGHFFEHLQRTIDLCGVPPAAITFDLTGMFLRENPLDLDNWLKAFSHIGVGLAIDDFGTGSASLAELTRLPANTLKLDHSFVDAIDGEAEFSALAESVIVLARRRNQSVIAEGVERPEHMARLLEMGCEVMQGYLFAAPMCAEKLEGWLVQRREDASFSSPAQ